METLSRNPVAVHIRDKDLCPPATAASGPACDSVSASSYYDYPADRPFINTLVHHTPETRTQSSYHIVPPSKAFPETNSAVILSALRNLQEKIRRLELDKDEAGPSHSNNDASHRVPPREQRTSHEQTDLTRENNGENTCNQALIVHLAAAESRCVKLERQLEYMRKVLRSSRTDLLHQTSTAAVQQSHVKLDHDQLEKLERLEREYLMLRRAQKNAEKKIRELEGKVQEEEHHRKLIQDKANQLQSSVEANRIRLELASPHSPGRPKEKKLDIEKSSQRPSQVEPHYRLNLKDVPFVTGKSVSSSHSVRANVQAVLSLLKQHQPHLCNSSVLLCSTHYSRKVNYRHTDASTNWSVNKEELSDLLKTLQEELRLMSSERDELAWQAKHSPSEEKRKELVKNQQRVQAKMEKKREQIRKLYKHKSQIKKLQRKTNARPNSGNEGRRSSRGRSAGAVKTSPGLQSRKNLVLLRDMKTLQASLQI